MTYKIIICVIYFCSFINSFAQKNHKEQFKFSVHKNQNEEMFAHHNFIMTRTHYSDSVFADGPLTCSDDTAICCTLTFKKTKGYWYVKTPEGWQEFYSPKDNLLKVVYFKADKFILKPIGQSLVEGKKTLLGFIKEPLYVFTSHNSSLYFDHEFGVVAIDGDNTLIREDFVKHNK